MMKTLQQQLSETRARLMKLEDRRRRSLLRLPAQAGFETVEELVAALQEVASQRGRVARITRRKKRAVITKDTEAAVTKMVTQKKTGSAIAAALGISKGSVAVIKRRLMLTRSSPVSKLARRAKKP